MMLDDEEVLVRLEMTERREELERVAAKKALRDQFAMAALTGMLSGPDGDEFAIKRKGSAVIAYEFADAMLAARGGK